MPLTQRRLHNEIYDFHDFVRSEVHEREIREGVIDRVMAAIGRDMKGVRATVRCFGSFPADLFLPAADMDLVYVSDELVATRRSALEITKRDMFKISNKLQRQDLAEDVKVLHQAKVPIIKFTDRLTQLPVDISFEKLDGLDAQRWFEQWKHEFEDMVPLVALVKQFLLMRNLNDVSNGGLGGFSTICLIVFYLGLRKRQGLVKNPSNIGEAFLGFLEYYGNFDLEKHRIIMDPPSLVLKVRKHSFNHGYAPINF